jgi:hypothetical protein
MRAACAGASSSHNMVINDATSASLADSARDRGPSTHTNSPCSRNSPSSARSINSARGPLSMRSCSFVSSFASSTSRSTPTISRRSANVLRSLRAASKNTTETDDSANSRNLFWRAGARAGRKPSNRNLSTGSGDTDKTAVNALGPGMGITRTPSARTRRTSSKPGSLISGVPASDTSATSWPCWRSSSSWPDRPLSL